MIYYVSFSLKETVSHFKECIYCLSVLLNLKDILVHEFVRN